MKKYDEKNVKKYFKILGKLSLKKGDNYSDQYINDIRKLLNHKGGALLDNFFNSVGWTSNKRLAHLDYMNKVKKRIKSTSIR